MRQRKLKDLDERMEDLADYLDKDGRQNKGQWRKVFAQQLIASSWEVSRMLYEGVMSEEELEQSLCPPDSQLCLEIGCGKGKFMCDRAKAFPDSMMIGIEGQESVIVRAAEKIREHGFWNAYLISGYVHDIHEFFEDGELDGIFLNFSDPWPKARHAKRRLTFRGFLEKYKKIIKPDGFIEVKTDNDGLYDFTLEEIEAMGYKIVESSRDLHNSEYKEGNITTEYEEKFAAKGKNINYVRIEFGGNMLLETVAISVFVAALTFAAVELTLS